MSRLHALRGASAVRQIFFARFREKSLQFWPIFIGFRGAVTAAGIVLALTPGRVGLGAYRTQRLRAVSLASAVPSAPAAASRATGVARMCPARNVTT
jgi:hypothetical protein